MANPQRGKAGSNRAGAYAPVYTRVGTHGKARPELGQVLSEMRRRRKLNTTDLAAGVVSMPTLARIEKGRPPRLYTLRMIIAALHRWSPVTDAEWAELKASTGMSKEHLGSLSTLDPGASHPDRFAAVLRAGSDAQQAALVRSPGQPDSHEPPRLSLAGVQGPRPIDVSMPSDPWHRVAEEVFRQAIHGAGPKRVVEALMALMPREKR